VIDDRLAQRLLRPDDGIGIGALTGQEQCTQRPDVVPGNQIGARILTLDRP
jgi:hypothetical protein